MLVFSISFKLNLVALSVETPYDITLTDILLDETGEVESNGYNLTMGDLVLQFAVNKV